MLTNQQINTLASRPGVRRIAVENFLGTIDRSLPKYGQYHNLYADSAAYTWNVATQRAIERGIELAYKR